MAFFNLRDDKMGERDLVPRVLLLRERTLVAACHVAAKIWEPKVREGKKSK